MAATTFDATQYDKNYPDGIERHYPVIDEDADPPPLCRFALDHADPRPMDPARI